MRMQDKKSKGFTLLEMMLVLVIVSSVIYMMIGYMQQRTLQTQIDRSVVQIQQILNAGLAYYVDHGKWPTNVVCLQGKGAAPDCNTPYLPSTIVNPFVAGTTPYSGAAYWMDDFNGRLIVATRITAGAAPRSYNIATIMAGQLPMSYTSADFEFTPGSCKPDTPTCKVVAQVTIPAQTLVNAGNVSFAGLYHHGGCVPVPTCPRTTDGTEMTAQVFIVPVSVSGVNDPGSSAVYPISSFTAYATGGTTATPPVCSVAYSGGDTSCGSVIGTSSSGNYWRACLQVITEKGEVAETNDSTSPDPDGVFPYEPWGGNVTLMAITRCQPPSEPSGSDFTVFTR